MEQHDARKAKAFAWMLMVMAIGVLLSSIFTAAIVASVAVPVASMFFLFAIVVFGRANARLRTEDDAGADQSESG